MVLDLHSGMIIVKMTTRTRREVSTAWYKDVLCSVVTLDDVCNGNDLCICSVVTFYTYPYAIQVTSVVRKIRVKIRSVGQ